MNVWTAVCVAMCCGLPLGDVGPLWSTGEISKYLEPTEKKKKAAPLKRKAKDPRRYVAALDKDEQEMIEALRGTDRVTAAIAVETAIAIQDEHRRYIKEGTITDRRTRQATAEEEAPDYPRLRVVGGTDA